MKKFLDFIKYPVGVGLVAGALVFCDSLIAPMLVVGASFTWIAFVNWTTFFSASVSQRLYGFLGLVTGFFFANFMSILGFHLNSVAHANGPIFFGTIIAVILVNILVIALEGFKRTIVGSTPGIFLGIAFAFSGAGIKLPLGSFKLLAIIMIYGILGQLCAVACTYLSKKFRPAK